MQHKSHIASSCSLSRPATGENSLRRLKWVWGTCGPDSRLMVRLSHFARTSSGSDTTVYLLPLNAAGTAAGEPRLVLNEPDGADFDWTADGRRIVYSSARNGSTSTLWMIPASGGMPEPLAIAGENA